MPSAGGLDLLIEIEEDVQQAVRLWNIDNRAIREDALHGGLEFSPLPLAVKIIDQQETAAQQVLPQMRGFLVVGIPVSTAGLLHEQEGILEDAVVGHFQTKAVFSNRQVRH